MTPPEYQYYQLIKLNHGNKQSLTSYLKETFVSGFFQSIESRVDIKKIFEGYDGVEYGLISKNIKLPLWFKEKHDS